MEAGREMDTLIAEKVMGWKQVIARWTVPSSGTLRGLPPFSTDSTAAWEVVEYLVHTLKHNVCFYYDEHKVVAEVGAFEGAHEFVAEAKTFPLALCLAALKSVDAEVPA